MSTELERSQFLDRIANSTPSHYSGDADLAELLAPFKEINYVFYSSAVLNFDLMTNVAMNFTQKYAGYTPGAVMENNQMFFSSDPLIIYSSAPDALDRTLIWANGLLSYTEPGGEISLMLDDKLVKMIEATDD